LPVVAASPPQAADSPATAAGAAQPARVTLRNVPAGATITRNGVRVSSPRFALEPNQRHVIRVQAAGFEPWEETVRLAAGQTRALTVTLRRAQATAASPGAAAPPAAQPAQTQPQVQPQPQPAQPAPQPAAPAAQPAVGYLFVGSTPATASITINGQVARSNPVTNYEVPAGSVTIVFRWTDTGGVPRDTTITLRVSPGETVRRRVNLPVN
ncbi:MAG TPA: PEGA domain-containing protein, partial [Gemmatimonadales bacterium]|nr:PEGA domain-containing protein [Gemmatimonadales bacterium]